MVPFSMTLSDLVIFYLKGAAYKSTYLLTYLLTSDPDFNVTTFFEVKSAKRRVLKTKLLLHNRKIT